MQSFALLSLLVSSLFFSGAVANNHVARQSHRAVHLNRQVNVTERALEGRASGVRFTYYDVDNGNQVACGGFHHRNEFVVALSAQNWAGGSHCGNSITITCNGKTTQATIVDECMGCPYDGLDFTEGLFQFFAPLSAGVISGDWNYGGAPAPPPAAKPKPAPPPPPPAPKPSPKAKPSTTPPPPAPSTTQPKPDEKKPTSTSTPAAAKTPTDDQPGSIGKLNTFVEQVDGMIHQGATYSN